MTDTSVINPDQPYRMPDQQAVQDWRRSTPLPSQQGDNALAPQSPLSALGPPPTPTAGPPPDRNVNFPAIPQKPTLQQLGPAPDAKEYQKGALAFASAMAVLGAVASKFTRVSGATALSAFAGAVNGWKQGNLQAYEDAAKKWQEDTKATIQNNKQILEDYRLTLENRQLNIDEQMAELKLKSAKWHDQMTYDAANANNYTLVAKIYEKNVEYTEKARKAAADLQERHDARWEKNEQSGAWWLSPDGQAKLQTLQPSQQAAVKQLIDIYAKKGAGRSNIAQNRQQFIDEYTDENGHPPTSNEITEWEANRAGQIAEGRVVGVRAGAIAIAVDEAEKTIPNVRALAQKSAGRGYATWNAVQNKWNVERGDKDFAKYVQQMNSLINVYGRVISGGGKGTVSDLEHARQMLNPNMPLSAVEGSLEGFETEIGIAEAAPGNVRAKMRGGSTTPAATPAAGTGGGAQTPKAGDIIKYDADGNRIQ